MLAFEKQADCPVADLLRLAHRQQTASQLNTAILSRQSQESESRLMSLLKLLMWSQAQLEERANFPILRDFMGTTDETSS